MENNNGNNNNNRQGNQKHNGGRRRPHRRGGNNKNNNINNKTSQHLENIQANEVQAEKQHQTPKVAEATQDSLNFDSLFAEDFMYFSENAKKKEEKKYTFTEEELDKNFMNIQEYCLGHMYLEVIGNIYDNPELLEDNNND